MKGKQLKIQYKIKKVCSFKKKLEKENQYNDKDKDKDLIVVFFDAEYIQNLSILCPILSLQFNFPYFFNFNNL